MGRPLWQEQRWEGKAGDEAGMGAGLGRDQLCLAGLGKDLALLGTMWEVVGGFWAKW